MEEHKLVLTTKDGDQQTIAFSACIWATGVAIHPLAKKIQNSLPAQSNFRSHHECFTFGTPQLHPLNMISSILQGAP